MDLKGRLSDVGLPFILQTINRGKMTGTLHLKHEDDTGEIYFKEGEIIFANASNKHMKLGEILLDQDKISKKEVNEILKRQKIENKKFGELLIDSGKITEEEIVKYLSFQAEEVIFQLLSLKEGLYHFIKNIIPEDLLVILTKQTASLIAEGKDRIDELLRIHETISSLNITLELNPNPKKQEKELDLTIDEWQVMSLIDNNRTVAQICSLSPAKTFTTCRILHNLISFDLVKPQNLRLFEEEEEDTSKLILRLTNMLVIFTQAFIAISRELYEIIGEDSLKILRECLRDTKENYPTLFENIDLMQNGTFDNLMMMHNILSLPSDQQLTSLRNGLNVWLVNIVIQVKDLLGKKKYNIIMKQVYASISDFFENEEKLRVDMNKNFQTVIKYTNQIPSSFKQGLTLFNEHKYVEAFNIFSIIPPSNPNYKKAIRYLDRICSDNPEIKPEEISVKKETKQIVSIEKNETSAEKTYAIAEVKDVNKKTGKSIVIQDLLQGLKLFSMNKFDKAIQLLDKVLVVEPLNVKASKYRTLAVDKLAEVYENKIGDLNRLPILSQNIGDEKLEKLTLSPHEGYLLSRVNGKYSINDIIGISGLDRYSALKIFFYFLDEGLVVLKEAPEELYEKTKTKPSTKDKDQLAAPVAKPRPLKKKPTIKTHRIDRKKLAEQHYQTGMRALKENEFSRSVEELEAAILNNPNKPLYYNLLAEAREKKRSIESGDYYESALFEIKNKNYAKAMRLLKKAILNAPRNFNYLITFADVLFKVPGKKEEALLYYRKALDLEPNNSDLIIKVGQLYKVIGKKDLAMKAFRNCLAIDSHNQKALRELRRLQLAI